MYSVQIDPAIFTTKPVFIKVAPEYRNNVTIDIDTYDAEISSHGWLPKPSYMNGMPEAPASFYDRLFRARLQPQEIDDVFMEKQWSGNLSCVAAIFGRFVGEGLIIVKKNGLVLTMDDLYRSIQA